MKRAFLMTALASACLVACNQGSNNGAANTQNSGPAAPTTNLSGPAPIAPPAAPAPSNPDVNAASGDLRSQLIGRWGRNNSCAESMEFRADGGISIPTPNFPPQARWNLQGNTIILAAPGEGEQPLGSAVIAGNNLELTRNGQKTTLIRCPG